MRGAATVQAQDRDYTLPLRQTGSRVRKIMANDLPDRKLIETACGQCRALKPCQLYPVNRRTQRRCQGIKCSITIFMLLCEIDKLAMVRRHQLGLPGYAKNETGGFAPTRIN